jgi:hypothetical protein
MDEEMRKKETNDYMEIAMTYVHDCLPDHFSSRRRRRANFDFTASTGNVE